MKPSLSMIMPVRDRETTIARDLMRILDVLPDLTPRWDLLVIDDGSVDATPEVVQELARPYPQVKVVHQSTVRGDNACFRWGAQRACGDVLLFRAADCNLDFGGLDKMWKRRDSHDLVIARSLGETVDGRSTTWSAASAAGKRTHGPALQMISRRAIEGWTSGMDDSSLQVYLARKGYPQVEVALRADASKPAAGLMSLAGRRGAGMRTGVAQHCDTGSAAGTVKRPNYLLRLKAFALGE